MLYEKLRSFDVFQYTNKRLNVDFLNGSVLKFRMKFLHIKEKYDWIPLRTPYKMHQNDAP